MKSSIKKAIAGLSVAAMLVSAMQVVSAWYNNPETQSDFETRAYGEGVSIEKYIGASKDKIEIPDEIEGEKVVCIKDYAFSNVVNDVTVYIPETVEEIRPEAFITAGSLNKVIVEMPGIENPTVYDLAEFWAKKIPGMSSPEKLKDDVMNKALKIANEKIDSMKGSINNTLDAQINGVLSGLTLDIKVPDLSAFKGLDLDIDLDFDEALKIAVDKPEVNVSLEEAKYIPDADGILTVNATTLEEDLNAQIKKQIDETVMPKIDAQINAKVLEAQGKVAAATEKVNTLKGKIDPEELNSLINDLENIEIPDVNEIAGDVRKKIGDSIDSMIGDIVNPVMTQINNYLSSAIVRSQDLLKGIPFKGSVSETAVEVLKSVRGFGDETYRNIIKENYDKASNKVSLIPDGDVIKKMNEYLDTLIDKYPYGASVSFVVETEDCDAAQFADDHGISYEVGAPKEPTVVTTGVSVVTVPVTYTSIVSGSVEYIPGTETSIVTYTQPKETVIVEKTVPVEGTVIVEKTVPVKETVIVEKTVPVKETVTVVVKETVLVTESTAAKPAYEKGDVNMNGKIDLYDAIWIAENMVNKREFTDEQKEIGDVSGNGKIDLYDAIGVATIMVKNSTSGK